LKKTDERSKGDIESKLQEAQNTNIEELFEENLEERNKFKQFLPKSDEKEQTIFDYFDPNMNKKNMTKKRDAMQSGSGD
jgi:hypothetical protein